MYKDIHVLVVWELHVYKNKLRTTKFTINEDFYDWNQVRLFNSKSLLYVI